MNNTLKAVMMLRLRSKEEKRFFRRQRALNRFFRGKGHGRLLLVTLTTPEWFKGDIHRAWRLFIWRMRHRGLKREYYAVKEKNAKGNLEHLHVVFRTPSIMDARVVRTEWLKAIKATTLETVVITDPDQMAEINNATFVWTEHEWCRDIGRMGAYLAKYLTKGVDSAERMYWYSADWVYGGWVGWSKAIWYLGISNREGNRMFDEDIRKYTGYQQGLRQLEILQGLRKKYEIETEDAEKWIDRQEILALNRAIRRMEKEGINPREAVEDFNGKRKARY